VGLQTGGTANLAALSQLYEPTVGLLLQELDVHIEDGLGNAAREYEKDIEGKITEYLQNYPHMRASALFGVHECRSHVSPSTDQSS
jgi:hypothetical protein